MNEPPATGSEARPRIVQICREIADGGGVSGVAAQLEAGFRAAGYECGRMTLESVGLRPRRPGPSQLVNKLFLLRDVVWYSIAGTVYARLRHRRPDTVVICHNDVLFGDIYINHGLHKLLVLRSPNRAKMLLRNPLHWFLLGREEIRHRLRLHRFVVTLSGKDSEDIGQVYPSTRDRVVQLSNGVHFDRFAAAAAKRPELRRAMGVGDDEVVLLFVGHEFQRKGLSQAIEALGMLDKRFRLWVVGGSASMIAAAAPEAAQWGVADRVRFFGTQKEGIEKFFGAADLMVLPSEYEAAALVLFEAMAAGLVPVVTPVGAAPDLIEHGVNGFLVDRSGASIAAAVNQAVHTPGELSALSKRANETAGRYGWPQVINRYLELVNEVHRSRPR